MKSTLIIPTLRLLSWVPLRWQRRVGILCAELVFLAGTRMVKTTLVNLQLAYPELNDEQRQRLTRASLRHTFQTICEAGGTWLWPAERALGCIERIEGLALLLQAEKAGKGVLLLAPHLGNWELFGLYLNNCGAGQSHQLFQPPADPALAALIHAARGRTGANMVPTDKHGVATLLRALKAGEIVGILPDQVPTQESGAFAPFFGTPALTMTLLNRLQQKTGARVLAGVARRTSNGFEIVISEPDPGIYEPDLTRALAAMNRTVEAMVRPIPEQYQWEYKRFKRQPDGGNSPYQD